MLQGIAAQCRKDKIPYIEFESIGDRRDERNRTTLDGDMDYLANVFISSEGEEIGMTLCKFAGKLGNFIRSNPSAEEIVVLIDALDSGFSIDNIVEAKESLFRFVIDDCKKNNTTLYIIVSANAYELASGERCFDPIKGEYISFDSYEQYRKYVLDTRKAKDRRYRKKGE